MLKQERVYRDIALSFETNEKGAAKFYFQKRTQLVHVRAVVTKAIAASDNGTVTFKDSLGADILAATVPAVITAVASDALNTNYLLAIDIDGDNGIVQAGDFITITTAKATAGGKIHLTIDGYETPAS